MKGTLPLATFAFICSFSTLDAQTVVPRIPYSYDESQVGALPIPPLLVTAKGQPVEDIATWEKVRRPELLSLFQKEVYGYSTADLNHPLKAEVLLEDTKALGGKATMRITRLRLPLAPKDSDSYIEVLSYLPNLPASEAQIPVFVGLNFLGNQTTTSDPRIPLTRKWIRNSEPRNIKHNRATDESRGTASERWPFEEAIARGYGVATAYYGDISLDHRDFYTRCFPEFFEKSSAQGSQASSIGAWAWGLSRIADYMRSLPKVNDKQIAVLGHSRLGKTSLWAGAMDERFSLVISNNSGASGAALSKRIFGERVADTYGMNPHWFTPKYRTYASNEEALPCDQHQLIALVAPRPVYIASATHDRAADPKGEFLGGKLASPAWELYGKSGLLEASPPPPDLQIGDFVGYHCRTGNHNILSYDWNQFMDFADRHWGSPAKP